MRWAELVLQEDGELSASILITNHTQSQATLTQISYSTNAQEHTQRLDMILPSRGTRRILLAPITPEDTLQIQGTIYWTSARDYPPAVFTLRRDLDTLLAPAVPAEPALEPE